MSDPKIPLDPIADLLDVLELKRISETDFVGRSQWMPQGRVFGGQVLAQSLVASMSTLPDTRRVHSLHSYFLRPGDVDQEINFEVEVLRDGRSFSARRVKAIQSGKPIFVLSASFQDEAPGLSHQEPMPKGLPEPESLPSAKEILGEVDHPAAKYWANARPFDFRHITEPIYLRPAKDKSADQMIWFKAIGEVPTEEKLHTAALAYASDYTILESILRNHGLSWAYPGLNMASLDHAMWFHGKPNVNDWMLYVQHSPSASGGRGLAFGSIYSKEGALLVSIAQEGMVRVPDYR